MPSHVLEAAQEPAEGRFGGEADEDAQRDEETRETKGADRFGQAPREGGEGGSKVHEARMAAVRETPMKAR